MKCVAFFIFLEPEVEEEVAPAGGDEEEEPEDADHILVEFEPETLEAPRNGSW